MAPPPPSGNSGISRVPGPNSAIPSSISMPSLQNPGQFPQANHNTGHQRTHSETFDYNNANLGTAAPPTNSVGASMGPPVAAIPNSNNNIRNLGDHPMTSAAVATPVASDNQKESSGVVNKVSGNT